MIDIHVTLKNRDDSIADHEYTIVRDVQDISSEAIDNIKTQALAQFGRHWKIKQLEIAHVK